VKIHGIDLPAIGRISNPNYEHSIKGLDLFEEALTRRTTEARTKRRKYHV